MESLSHGVMELGEPWRPGNRPLRAERRQLRPRESPRSGQVGARALLFSWSHTNTSAKSRVQSSDQEGGMGQWRAREVLILLFGSSGGELAVFSDVSPGAQNGHRKKIL